MWHMRFLTTSALVFGLAACSTTGNFQKLKDAHLAINPYDTIANPSEIYLLADMKGRLETDGNCIVANTSAGPITLLWPEGTVVTIVRGKSAIMLPHGRGTAFFSNQINFGGATLPVSQSAAVAQLTKDICPQDYFVVSTIGK
ncbi:hypothetical protein [Parasphingorhabdus cellanae]|uniref:Lipoprotein n=1 Tax=Parasphingorhabdus cellanae TaxID=2806553 RepID=A0ABX7T500_9SPHN|nr:hypothetical protein [Parasphingorhabdus cellanae]QTD55063.1 hypothetical protein J4G78_12610 [Parasphingorhabdus cellanae]